MCEFLSAIVMRNGDVLTMPELTDSHSDMVRHFKLNDTDAIRRFAKVEFTPPAGLSGQLIYDDWQNYKLRVDETTRPDWFDEVEEQVRKKLTSIIREMIVSDSRDLLLGGCHILINGAVVGEAKSARIMAMYDSAQVGEMSGSAQVRAMYGSAQVRAMSGSAQVGEMSDSAQVGEMYGSAQVGEMSDSAQVRAMYDSAQAPKAPTTDKRVKATASAQK